MLDTWPFQLVMRLRAKSMLAVGIEPTYTEVRRIYSPLSHHCGLASQIDFGEKGFSPFRSATILSPQRIKHFLKFWAGLTHLPLSPLGDCAYIRYANHPVLIKISTDSRIELLSPCLGHGVLTVRRIGHKSIPSPIGR